MLIVFVAGIDRTENRAGCITVGVLIHYFTLVAWMWMGAEALLFYKKVVLVFGETTLRFILLVTLVCWGKCTHTHTHTHTCVRVRTQAYDILLWVLFITANVEWEVKHALFTNIH